MLRVACPGNDSGECDQYYVGPGRYESSRPIKIDFFSSSKTLVSKIHCGSQHTLALTTAGDVYSWGCNDDGALGRVGSPENTPAKIDLPFKVDSLTAGDSHSLFINSTNGIIYMSGVYRNVLKGNMTDVFKTPVQIGRKQFQGKSLTKVTSGVNHTFVLLKGEVFAWGDPETGVIARKASVRRKFKQGLQIEAIGIRGVTDVFAGENCGFLTKQITNRRTKESRFVTLAWGLNNYGQLGIGN